MGFDAGSSASSKHVASCLALNTALSVWRYSRAREHGCEKKALFPVGGAGSAHPYAKLWIVATGPHTVRAMGGKQNPLVDSTSIFPQRVRGG
jgi:hypothetical protein